MTCIFCGSRTHTYRSCPTAYLQKPAAAPLKAEYFGQAPNVFIGRHGYPRVRVGILGTEQYDKHDDPQAWAREGTPIPAIVRLRSSLVNSYFAAAVKGAGDRFTHLTREVSLAKRPVDVEVNLSRVPVFRMTFNQEAPPHGPNVALKAARITENVPVDVRVEKATDATDLRASEAISKLLRQGVDTYFLTKAFSMGNFGLPVERKLVPTRWSITAVDDIASKRQIDELKRCAPTDCVAYFGGHLGNFYLLLLFDGNWQYELFEQYLPSSRDRPAQLWTDYEPYAGRKEYAHETAGGYYAARIGITTHLLERRRQASVLAIRIITDEYTTPLGVWVVREAVRKALAAEPVRFADRHLMLAYAKEFLRRKFGFDLEPSLRRSLLVKELFGQRKLSEW